MKYCKCCRTPDTRPNGRFNADGVCMPCEFSAHSKGINYLERFAELRSIVKKKTSRLALLKCTSAYPAPVEEANLARIPHMAQTFGVRVGLSDHTMGSSIAVAAVALGAQLIEKHLCRSRSELGPDSAFSMEPIEFTEMVQAIRTVEKAIGRITYEPTEKESAELPFRRSLFVTKNIKAGEIFTDRNIRSIRPGHGLPPKYLPLLLGRKASRALERETPMDWDSVGT
jgi:pseudaminic acid synthase